MVDKAGADQALRDREKLSILPCRPFYFGHADDTRVSDSDQEPGQNVRGLVKHTQLLSNYINVNFYHFLENFLSKRCILENNHKKSGFGEDQGVTSIL